MGISWSGNGRRRHSTYNHNPPPPLPPYYYSTEPLALPLPPPPPPIHSHYCYANHHLMGRFHYHPPYYYGSQAANGWPVIGPDVGLPQSLQAAPYVEHRNAKKVRNDVNVHKDTLRVEVDKQNPENHLVSFVLMPCSMAALRLSTLQRRSPAAALSLYFLKPICLLRSPFRKVLARNFVSLQEQALTLVSLNWMISQSHHQGKMFFHL